MTPLERAMSEIQKRQSVRTPVLGALLDMSDEEVDRMLTTPRSRGELIACNVEAAGKKMIEYRISSAPGMDWVGRGGKPLSPKTAAGLASAGTALLAHERPAAPVPAAAPQEAPMMEGTVIERAVAALQKHGRLTIDELVDHTKATKATIYTVVGTLKKKHGVTSSERGVYEIGAKATTSPQKATPAKAGANPYAEALAGLAARRNALQAEVSKLDKAIEAIEALA